MDGPDSRTDKHSITFPALLQPQFASERPLLSHMDIAGRQIWRTGIHPEPTYGSSRSKVGYGHKRALLLPALKGYGTDTACPDSEKKQNDVLLEKFRETELNSIVVDGSAYSFTTLVNPFGLGDPSMLLGDRILDVAT
jgi:hypothetical protein